MREIIESGWKRENLATKARIHASAMPEKLAATRSSHSLNLIEHGVPNALNCRR
jgi:hypothetical protein